MIVFIQFFINASDSLFSIVFTIRHPNFQFAAYERDHYYSKSVYENNILTLLYPNFDGSNMIPEKSMLGEA